MIQKPIATYLNQLGIINALGAGKAEVWEKFSANDNSSFVPYAELFSGRKTWVAKVKAELPPLPEKFAHYDCNNNRFVVSAYQQIAAEVEALKKQYGASRIAVVMGTNTSGMAEVEAAFKHYKIVGKYPDDFNYAKQELGSCSEFLREYAGLTGPAYTSSSACSASGKAIAAANRLIQNGICDAAIVGGSDALCQTTLNGFDALNLLSEAICNPFSKNRSGINLGEGAALFILSKQPGGVKLLGTGESSDAYHMSAPDPQGVGAKIAMTQALEMAAITPEQVGYINLHGTASAHNDSMESLAVYDLFGSQPYCSSTKPLTGHTLGAAGAQDLALCWLLLSDYNTQHILPAQLFDGEFDPELKPIKIPTQTVQWQDSVVLSNSFAFGGSNICLAIARE